MSVADDTGDSFFDLAKAAIIKPARRFGSIIAQVVISENHVDDSEITSHPVEIGANVSDHIILLPSRLIVRMGFTDYGLQSVGTYINEGLNSVVPPIPASIQKVYNSFLAMRDRRIPFAVITGKRNYKSIVIKTLVEETDYRTDNSLIITAYCQAVLLVQTQVVAVPPNALHADASASGSPTNYGTKLLAPAPATVVAP